MYFLPGWWIQGPCLYLIGSNIITMHLRLLAVLFSLIMIQVWFVGCTKSGSDNPFDNVPPPPPPDTTTITPDMSSITGLHTVIFGPTCANSGCHDGTFEPDFRTIESTYNTMVLHPIIKNDPQGTYTHRVVPGNPDASQLIARLTYDIDGQSGIMPLITDPSSDWPTMKETYIQYIRAWIQNGAPDIQGNTPSPVDAIPSMQGNLGRVNGINMERADGGQGALRVPQNVTSLTLLFSFTDDKTLPANFTGNTIRFSSGPDDFNGKAPLDLEIVPTPISDKGFFGSQVPYTHRITINPKDYAVLGETIFFRTYVQDSSNPVTEIPTNASAYYFKTYFSLTIIE